MDSHNLQEGQDLENNIYSNDITNKIQSIKNGTSQYKVSSKQIINERLWLVERCLIMWAGWGRGAYSMRY